MPSMIQSVINFISSLGFALVAVFGINLGTEGPHYEVVQRMSDNVEIRRYAARVVAETTVDADHYDNPRREAFGRIAGYIFGANKGRRKIEMTSPVEVGSSGEKIPMTTPVEVNASEARVVMRFFMPSNLTKDELPEPTDSRVTLVALPPATVAALRYSGSSSLAIVAVHTEELLQALKTTDWKTSGSPTTYVYNPPWTIPFLKHNEIVVPVVSEQK